MLVSRRELLFSSAAAATGSLSSSAVRSEAPRKRDIKAIAFDGFVIFDPRPVASLAEELFPGKGAELTASWRARQFEYSWLRALTGRYADFWKVTEDALVFAAKLAKLDLTFEKRARLMQANLELGPWPGVREGLKSLHDAGLRLALLSNFSPGMLDSCIRRSGLEGMFFYRLSTDAVKTYKPDPRAYELGTEAFGLPKENILFAAFGGWDASGAKSFGYETFWFNPGNLPAEELGQAPDGAGTSFSALLSFLQSRRRAHS